MKRLTVLFFALLMLLAACTQESLPDVSPAPDDTFIDSPVTASPEPLPDAMTIGGTGVSQNTFRYYFYTNVYNFLNTYGYMMSSDFGFDLNSPLDQQMFSQDTTWQDFFRDQTSEVIFSVYVLNGEAEKAGITLDDSDYQLIDEYIQQFAGEDGADIDAKLVSLYGGSMNQQELRDIVHRDLIARKIYDMKTQEFTPSQFEAEQYYDAHSIDFDMVSYLQYDFQHGLSDDNTSEDATASAQELYDAVSDEDSFLEYVSDTLQEESENTKFLSYYIQGDRLMDWLFDSSRLPGDKTILQTDNAAHVLYFKGVVKDEIVSVRHILLTSDNVGADAARAEAQRVYELWLEGGATEDSFAALAAEYSTDPGSADNGGLYDNVTKDQMVPTFDAWCFEPTRQYSDSGLVDTDYGTHIMFFVGRRFDWTVIIDTITQNRLSEYVNSCNSLYPMQMGTIDVSLPQYQG